MEPVNQILPPRAASLSAPATPTVPAAVWAAGMHAMGLGARGITLPGAASQGPAQYPQFHYHSAADAAAAYADGAARAGRRVEARRGDGAARQELVVVHEFAAWLLCLPSFWGRSLATAVPEDVTSFFEAHWVKHHGRTLVGDAVDPVASYSGTKGALLHLEHYFDAIGRSGPWQPPAGNPCRGEHVINWRLGYERTLWRAGVRPVAAWPFCYC